MSAVMNTIGVAFAYAVLALFAQNAIFTRGLGVSRLIQLVGDERTSSWWFALLLCVTQTLVAPLAYFAGSQIVDLPYRAPLRPLLYLACVAVVCIFEHAILRVRFVTSDHLLRMGAWGKFIKFSVNPIPKRRGADSEKTMEMMAESVRNGVSVCIHAEGFCSINGETGFVSPRTGQLVKDSGAGLITFRTVGGYFKDPRWAKHSRRGRMRGSVVREYMPEELQRMSVDEINEAIRRDIYINAYEQQRKNPHKYKGRALAEDLETILYLCPKCHAIGKTHSHDNEFSCECGYKMHINEYGFFEGDSLVFDNVLDWDKWQKSYVKDNLALWRSFTEKPITSDEKQILNCIEENETKELFSDNCTMSIYADRLEFSDESKGKKVFMLSDIVKMSMGGETKLYFTTSNGFYYEVGSHTRRSSVKYFALYRVLTGREYL